MKKLINDPRHVVREMLEGLVDLHPELAILDDEDGGGARRPARAGAAARGGAVGRRGRARAGPCRLCRARPARRRGLGRRVHLAERRRGAGRDPGLRRSAGAVLIVKNYTGDRLNFGLAAELARPRASRPTSWWSPTTWPCATASILRARAASPETVLVHKVAGCGRGGRPARRRGRGGGPRRGGATRHDGRGADALHRAGGRPGRLHPRPRRDRTRPRHPRRGRLAAGEGPARRRAGRHPGRPDPRGARSRARRPRRAAGQRSGRDAADGTGDRRPPAPCGPAPARG